MANWRFVPTGNGFFHVFNQHSGLALSLDSGGSDLVKKQADAISTIDNWCFVAQGNGYFAVMNLLSGASIDVDSWSQRAGDNVHTWGYYGGANQMWKVDLATSDGPPIPDLPPIPPPATAPPQETSENRIEPFMGPYGTPVVRVAMANLPSGKILLWSAYLRTIFDYDDKMTWTALYDPETGDITEKLVDETKMRCSLPIHPARNNLIFTSLCHQHDMFCPGTATLADGRLMITGRADSLPTTFYDDSSNTWTVGPEMKINRGYHAMTVLQDGSVFTIGGSWHGGIGGKIGEIWSPFNDSWRILSGVPIEPC